MPLSAINCASVIVYFAYLLEPHSQSTSRSRHTDEARFFARDVEWTGNEAIAYREFVYTISSSNF